MPRSLLSRYGFVGYGRRDSYQIPLALLEAGVLDRVFTDFYLWDWVEPIIRRASIRLPEVLLSRRQRNLPSRFVEANLIEKTLAHSILRARGVDELEILSRLDARLSQRAAAYAQRNKIGMVTYSYYWSELAAAKQDRLWDGPGIVFQVHPIASQVRAILSLDRKRTGLSYLQEAEEQLSEAQVRDYSRSLQFADGVIGASTFTAKGLIDAGVPRDRVRVVAYGAADVMTSLGRASSGFRTTRPSPRSQLRLLWVGQMAYRKGPHHLFEALRQFSTRDVHLSIVTRGPLASELEHLLPPHAEILGRVSDQRLEELYLTHDLLVMPSLVEGFGLVYLEALSCGLPILATNHSGAPDIIKDECEGFIVEAGNSEAIASKIDSCLSNPGKLREMSISARKGVKQWTWERFRGDLLASLQLFEQQA